MPQKIEQLLQNRMQPEEQEIRDHLNFPSIDPASGVAPTAPAFRKQTEVWSTNPSLLRQVERLLSIAPEMRGKVNRVEQGRSADVSNSILSEEQRGPLWDMWDGLNMLGLFGRKSKNVWIKPELDPEEQANTLAHEFSHASGFEHGDPELEKSAAAMGKLYKPGFKPVKRQR